MARSVEFEAGGKRYALRMTINALCQIEAETKMTFAAVAEEMKGGGILLLRTVFGAALGGKLGADRVGDILDDLGMTKAVELLTEAIALAFPEAAPPDEGAAGN